MFSFLFAILVLKLSFPLCSPIDNRCFWRLKTKTFWEGDKEIDCFFFIYTRFGHVKNEQFSGNLDKRLTSKTIHLILTLYFALEEINRNPHILPNISLLVKIECRLLDDWRINSLSSKREKYLPNYYCINQRRYLIVLTGPMWLASVIVGPLLYITKRPELYYGPFHPLLSNQELYPYLYQMASKDLSLALAMVSLLVHFSWNWVGAVVSDDDPGYEFILELRREMQRNNFCLAFVSIIVSDDNLFLKRYNIYYNQIKMSSAKVVIIYGDKDSPLQVNFRLWNLFDIQRIWVTTSQWDMIINNGKFLLNSFYGTLSFSHHYSELSGFKTFIQTAYPSNYSDDFSLGILWWVYFNCSLSLSECKDLQNCPKENIFRWLFRHHFEMSLSDTTYDLYNSMYAVAYTLQQMLLKQADTWQIDDGKEPEFDSWQMLSFLRNIQFINPVGDKVNLNHEEKLDTKYEIHQTLTFLPNPVFKLKIGTFSQNLSHGRQLYMLKEMIEWNTGHQQSPTSVCSIPCSPGFRKSPQLGKPVCCFDCTPCPENEISNMTNMNQCIKCLDDQYANPGGTHCLKKVIVFLGYEDPLGMSLAILALCFSALTAFVLSIFLKHQETPTVKANNRTLSYVLLISLISCFLCSLLFIGHPSFTTCIMQQTTFAVVFTVAASTVLAKTIIVILAFKVTNTSRKMRWLLVSGAPKFIIPICTMIQLILCGIWLGTSPPFVDADGHVEKGHILIFCNKGSILAFYCVLGYLVSIAIASFTLAFFARNLPDTFNEAKFLTFSMLVFCSVWVTFLPVYHSTKGKSMVAVEVFCILASSAGLLFCIFAPKCFIILLRPEKKSFQKFQNIHSKI
uniref:vomeronasal 2 receptor 41 n=1 Tax=Rattus norvegicus TaxID=10116 RepID=UPI002645D7D2